MMIRPALFCLGLFWLTPGMAMAQSYGIGSQMDTSPVSSADYDRDVAPIFFDLTPDEIAGDVHREIDPRRGQSEFVAPTFDPFEGDPDVAGSAQLRTVTAALDLDGHSLRDGVRLDVSLYYIQDRGRPFGRTRDARFLNGDPVSIILRDSRELECSTRVTERLYHRDRYEPFYSGPHIWIQPDYRGHRRWGTRRGLTRNRYLGRTYGLGWGSGRAYRDRRAGPRPRPRTEDQPRPSDSNRRRNRDRIRPQIGDLISTPTDRRSAEPRIPPVTRDRDDRPRPNRPPRRADGSVRRNLPTTIIRPDVRAQPRPRPTPPPPPVRATPPPRPNPAPVQQRPAPRRSPRSDRLKEDHRLFPGDGVSDVVVVSSERDCAREDELGLFIPLDRLEAARFDGLTLIIREVTEDPRTGQVTIYDERPLFIPPNYIEGFRQAAGLT